ncbi:hypothetical protein AB6D53_01915 [Vibrio splendidus]
MTDSIFDASTKAIKAFNAQCVVNPEILNDLETNPSDPLLKTAKQKIEAQEDDLQEVLDGIRFDTLDIDLTGAKIRSDINPLDFTANLNTAIVLADNTQKLIQTGYALDDNQLRIQTYLKTLGVDTHLDELQTRTEKQKKQLERQCQRVVADLANFTKAARVGLHTLLEITDNQKPDPGLSDFENLMESLHRLREHYRNKESNITDHIIPVSLRFAKDTDGNYILPDGKLSINSNSRYKNATVLNLTHEGCTVDLTNCAAFRRFINSTSKLWVRDVGAQVNIKTAHEDTASMETLSLSLSPDGGVPLTGVANLPAHKAKTLHLTGCLNTKSEPRPTWAGHPSIIGFSPMRKWTVMFNPHSLLSSPLADSGASGQLLDVILYFHVLRYSE